MTNHGKGCADYAANNTYPWIEALSDWAFADAILCPFQTTIGGPQFATLIIGVVGMAYMIRQGSLGIAAVVMVVAGGVFISQVAAPAVGIITVVVLTLLGLIPVLVVRRMSR